MVKSGYSYAPLPVSLGNVGGCIHRQRKTRMDECVQSSDHVKENVDISSLKNNSHPPVRHDYLLLCRNKTELLELCLRETRVIDDVSALSYVKEICLQFERKEMLNL